MEKKSTLTCSKCNVELQEFEANFVYLEKTLQHKVLRCPECGQVYLPEEMVRGRIREVEDSLEEK
ncbi:MAG: hypothetical protein Q4A48_01090 [Bacillota bacterium]|nr:hypothetical protein [Bacillota bacterium]MBR2512043.1 hypothetical protein [Bacillota bacterium]MDO4859601.1 hypothetical protein [Bacillota bacterium]